MILNKSDAAAGTTTNAVAMMTMNNILPNVPCGEMSPYPTVVNVCFVVRDVVMTSSIFTKARSKADMYTYHGHEVE